MRELSPEALEELNRALGTDPPDLGRPGIDSLSVPTTARRGQSVRVSWRATALRNLTLIISHPGGYTRIFPLSGYWNSLNLPYDMPIGSVEVRLRGTEARTQAVVPLEFELCRRIQILAPAPTVEIDAPQRIIYGESATIAWRCSDTVRAFIRVGSSAEVQVGPEDQIAIHPDSCGTVRIRIRAIGDEVESEGCRSIDVLAPPIHWNMPKTVLAELGENIAVRYEIGNARFARLRPLDRKEPERDIPLRGRIEVRDVFESERFELSAIAMDGEIHACIVRIKATPAIDPTIDDILEILNGKFDDK